MANEPWWKKAAKTAGSFAYTATPADNIVNIAREFGKPGGPNWGTIGKNVAGGTFDTLLMALPAARAGKIAYGLGSSIPGIAARAAGAGAVSGLLAPAAINLAMTPFAGGQTQMATPQQFSSIPSVVRNRPTPAGVTETQDPAAAAAAAGITGNVAAPPTGLFALDPRMQAQLDLARRQAVSANERALADIATRGTQLSIGGAATRRGIGRRARGGMLDLMSSLAELGYTSSPAMAGVGQEAIAAREAAERSRAAQELASGRSQLGQETAATRQNLRDILDRLRAEEMGGRAFASFQGLQNFYGGR